MKKSFFIYLFIFSFFIRAITFAFYLSKNSNFWQVDSELYHNQAVQIANGNGIKNIIGKSDFYRLPGYPFFLSAYYKLFGVDKKNVLWLQIIISSFIPLLIFLFSLTLFPSKLLLAKFSSIYSSVHLGLVLYSGFFMTESLFIFLFLIFLILFFKSILSVSNKIKNYRYRFFFISGLFLGLASLVRPVGQYFIVLVFFLILFFLKSNFYKKIKSCFVILLGWAIPILPLLLRNYLLLGQLFFHVLPGGHFLYLSAARIVMHTKNCSYWKARDYLTNEAKQLIAKKEKKLKRKLNKIEDCNLLQNLAIKYFKKNRFLAMKNWLTDILRTSLSLYSAELVYLYNKRKTINYFKKGRTIFSMFSRYLFPKVKSMFLKLIIWIEIILFLFILVGFFMGILISILNFKNYYNLFYIYLKTLPFVSLFIVLSLAGGYARMRLPIEPFLIIFSLNYWIMLKKGFRHSCE